MAELATSDEADEKSDAEGAENALRGVLTDVVFSLRMPFASAFAGVIPLFLGGLAEMSGLFRGDSAGFASFFRGDFAQVGGTFEGAFLDGEGLFGQVLHFAFGSGAKIMGGLCHRGAGGKSG